MFQQIEEMEARAQRQLDGMTVNRDKMAQNGTRCDTLGQSCTQIASSRQSVP